MNSTAIKDNKNLHADLVVIGGGGAGLAAAITAAEGGVKKVILLESRQVLGGNSALASGFFTVGGPAYTQEDIAKDIDGYFQKTMNYSHWRNNPKLVRTLIQRSVDMVPWLEAMGLKLEWDDTSMSLPIYRITGSGRGGAKLVKILTKRCEELGVELHFQTKAKKLISDGAGNLTGILAEKKDGEVSISANSFIIATGGFAGNKELLRKYFPDLKENDTTHLGGLPHQGDGLLMATEIGAATDGMAFLEMSSFMFPGSTHLALLAKNPNAIWVNREGERFVNESIQLWPEAANSIYRQPGKIFYSLFDEGTKQFLFDKPLSPMDQHAIPEGSWPRQVIKDLQVYAEKDKVKITDSWSDIAQWMGTSPEDLRASIDEYNICCDNGHDMFLKEKQCLRELRTPPFYGIRCVINILVTHGDIKTNHKMEVLDKLGSPIPGIYAAGDDTGGVDSDTYNFHLPGHSLGFAVNSGRIAGENALKYLLSIDN